MFVSRYLNPVYLFYIKCVPLGLCVHTLHAVWLVVGRSAPPVQGGVLTEA